VSIRNCTANSRHPGVRERLENKLFAASTASGTP
jgi:hypothetical protein